MTASTITTLDHVEFSVAPWFWPFAEHRRADIDTYFAGRQARTPELWNGRVLLLREHVFSESGLGGIFFETDFASFLFWLNEEYPDRSVVNCFSMGALRGNDGAYLLGVMGKHTSNPGHIYFPSGAPDQKDICGETVDIGANVLREVAEETGLTTKDFDVEAGWTSVVTGQRIALMKVLQAREPADALRARILRHLASERQSELADIYIVRHAGDITVAMPPFVTAFLHQVLPR